MLLSGPKYPARNCIRRESVTQYAEYDENRNFRGKLAAPFLSAEPCGYNPATIPSVLIVGKATRGDWDERYEARGSRCERRKETEDFIEKEIKRGKGMWAFFRFAARCADIAAQFSPVPENVKPYQNLVWSNLAKIGTVSGNPNGKYCRFQEEMAVQTLREEISFYRPELVVLTTGEYQEQAMYNATAPKEKWRTENEKMCYWWRPASNGLPALLWTYHPQGKSRKILDAWAAQAKKLIESSRTPKYRDK